jgi:hypothetical protein
VNGTYTLGKYHPLARIAHPFQRKRVLGESALVPTVNTLLLFISNTISPVFKIWLIANQFTITRSNIGLGVIGSGATLLVQSREVAGSIPSGSTFLLFFCIFFGIFLLHECNRSAPALRVGLVPGRITAGTPSCFDVSGGRRIYGRYVPPAPEFIL